MTTLFFNRAIYNLQALLNCIAANAWSAPVFLCFGFDISFLDWHVYGGYGNRSEARGFESQRN
jgi:hypothetical protein